MKKLISIFGIACTPLCNRSQSKVFRLREPWVEDHGAAGVDELLTCCRCSSRHGICGCHRPIFCRWRNIVDGAGDLSLLLQKRLVSNIYADERQTDSPVPSNEC